MIEQIFNALSYIGQGPALFLVSMIPLIELRGSVILGAALQMPWTQVLPICIIGNLLPIPFVLIFGKKLIDWLKTVPLFSGFARRYEEKLLSKRDQVEKYATWGLCLFVAIPLPGTGAWSGAALASILGMRIKHSLPAIVLGVCIAGIIMTVSSYGLLTAIRLF